MTSNKSGAVYEVNLKATIGILDAEIGERQLNTLLTAIDIPIIHSNTLKRNERIVGPAIEQVAEDTCRKNIELEKRKTLQNDRTASIDSGDIAVHKSVGLKVSYDAGWQKRSTGHAYNSLSGKSVTGILEAQELSAVYANNKVDLQVLRPNAGITLEILKQAYANGEGEVIRLILGEDIGGHPRVTKTARIILQVSEQIRLLRNEEKKQI